MTAPVGMGLGPFLVCGASGPLGGKVAEALARRGARVRGLARSEAGAQRALDNGAHEVAIGDLWDARVMKMALEGCRGAFYFSPRAVPDEAALGRAFIAAAERAGLDRLAVISMLQAEAPIPNHRASLEVEGALGRSPLKHTILRSGMFLQALPGIAEIATAGWIGRPYSVHRPLGVVDQYDVAEAAAMALTSESLLNGTFEVCSEGMVSLADIAHAASEILGKPIEARKITLEEWAREKGEAFASPYRRETYTSTFEHIDQYGFKGGNGFVLGHILGRPPTSVREYFARAGRSPWAEVTS